MGIQWRNSLSIGVEAIDNQHKELLARFDKLLSACQAGHGVEELSNVLSFLEEYVRIHFNDEEALQKLHRYPEYDAHRTEHLYFIEQLKKLRNEIHGAGASSHHVVETNNMLLKWLLNHISIEDVKIGAFIKANSP